MGNSKNMISVFAIIVAVNLAAVPNTIGTHFLDNPGEILFEKTQPIDARAANDKTKRIAVVISGQTSRCLIGKYLRKHLLSPNSFVIEGTDQQPVYEFHIFVDLTHSAVHASGSKTPKIIAGQFKDLPVKSIVIRTKPTLPKYPGTGSYKFPNRYTEWYNKNEHNLYEANLQAMYTKFRLKETVQKIENDVGFQYDMYCWFREDQAFTNEVDVVAIDAAVEKLSIVSKDCKQFNGVNEKLFFMKDRVFGFWGDFIRNFYEESIPGIPTIDGCYNSEQCHQKYFENLKLKIKRLGVHTIPMCDALEKNGNVCFKIEYCEQCSVPFHHQNEKIDFCEFESESKINAWMIVAIALMGLIVVMLFAIFFMWRRWRKKMEENTDFGQNYTI